jgi:hypothetical protein
MGQIIKVQRPVSSASIGGLYVILEAHLQYLCCGYYCTNTRYDQEAYSINKFLFNIYLVCIVIPLSSTVKFNLNSISKIISYSCQNS